MHYIMVMRDTRYWLVGPFATKERLWAWAECNAGAHSDPRWQSIELDDPHTPPLVMPPEHGEI